MNKESTDNMSNLRQANASHGSATGRAADIFGDASGRDARLASGSCDDPSHRLASRVGQRSVDVPTDLFDPLLK